MDQRRRLFIYDRKEVGILILLGVGVALFAFTLGVHLGKQVVPKVAQEIGEAPPVDPLLNAESQAPSRVEISGEVKNIPGAVDESLDQSLRDEIAKTGMKVDKARQVELPSEVQRESSAPEVGRAEPASNKKIESATEPKSEEKAVAKSEAATSPTSSRYTLQVGSYPSLREAEPELLKLNENGLRAEVREVELSGKGKWFRLFVGQFESVKDAEKAGKSFKKERRIAEFVVVRTPPSTSKE